MTPPPPPPSVRVLGIPGSLRDGSFTRGAVSIALEGAKEEGADVELLDLRALALPFCDARDDETTYPPAVERLREAFRAADGIVLGTPEYHGSVSGVLKNALDLVGFEETEGKMIGLVSVGGGAFGGSPALAELRHVGRALHAWVVPEECAVPRAGKAFDAAGRPVEPRVEKRLREVGRQVARFARLHKADASCGFLQEWERSVPNPGGPRR